MESLVPEHVSGIEQPSPLQDVFKLMTLSEKEGQVWVVNQRPKEHRWAFLRWSCSICRIYLHPFKQGHWLL